MGPVTDMEGPGESFEGPQTGSEAPEASCKGASNRLRVAFDRYLD